MKYVLSDKDLLQLNLLIPISEFSTHFPHYCPPTSTIYKRLNKYFKHPAKVRKDFEKTVFKASVGKYGELPDRERYQRIRASRFDVLVETIQAIHEKAARYEELTR